MPRRTAEDYGYHRHRFNLTLSHAVWNTLDKEAQRLNTSTQWVIEAACMALAQRIDAANGAPTLPTPGAQALFDAERRVR